MPKRYVGSFPQEETEALAAPADRGKKRHFFYSDTDAGHQQAESFAQRQNKPGRAVFDCIGILADGATQRRKEDVIALDKVVNDVDPKGIVEPREKIVTVIQGLTLQPSILCDSGHGFWPEWHFKEPVTGEDYLDRCEVVMRRLAVLLAADPVPTHRAALKRRPGTDNYKDAEPLPCRIIVQTGKQYDLSELEEMLDLYGDRPLLTRKEQPKSNGHDRAAGSGKGRINIAAGLDAMHYKGLGTAALHNSQLQISAAMLRSGVNVELSVDELLARTKENNADDPNIAKWEWGNIRRGRNGDPGEEWRIREMCYSFINKNPELAHLLADKQYATWRAKELAGETHIRVKWSGFQGGCWCVVGYKPKPGDDTNTNSARETEEEPAEEPKTKEPSGQKIRRPIIYSCAQFVADLAQLDYLVDGILQRRFIYSFTGKTGDGKTSVINLLALCVADGRMFCGHQCEKGTVVVLVGENPDDVRMRWAGMASEFGFDLNKLDIHFIPGVFAIDQIRSEIERVAEERKIKISLLIVDTSAAYFSGNDENSNVQLGGHARILREAFVSLPGQPCVVVTTHPTKNPDMENLLPRGGGAYLAEMDGNLVAIRNETTITVHWHGKFRGPDFDPMNFELVEVFAPSLLDTKGRQIPTIVARALDEATHAIIRTKAREENDVVLQMLLAGTDMSLNDIAVAAKWVNKKNEPNKSRARVVTDRLRKNGLVRLEQDMWVLTSNGEKAALRAKQRQQEKSFGRV